MDWSGCDEVELVQGVPFLKGTRVRADSIMEKDRECLVAREIAPLFDLNVEQVEKVIEFFWSGCDEVEQVQGKVSGVPILKGTRVQVNAITGNYQEGYSAQEVADMFRLDVEQVQKVVDYFLKNATDEEKQFRMASQPIDPKWQGCDEVVQVPGAMRGRPLLNGTHELADSVILLYQEGMSLEQLADVFEVKVEQVRSVIDFYLKHR